MTSEWPEVSIDDLKASTKNAIAMGPFGSRIKAENFREEGVPVIKGGNLNGDFILEDSFDFLSEEKADDLKASNAFRRDIVITHRGTIGQVGIIPDNSKYERYVVSQSQLKVTLDQEKVNPYFVYYFLRSPLGQHRLLMHASQVGVPAIAKASTSVKGILVPCPDKAIQNRVVEILLNLDHKIELNRQINQTLEQIAQAIFKSWFVDFEPVKAKIQAKQNGQEPERAAMRAISGKSDEELDQLSKEQLAQLTTTATLFPDELEDSELGEIPKGWAAEPLGNYLEVKRGGSPRPIKDYIVEKGLPWVKIADATANGNPYLFKTKECIKEEGLKKTVYLKKGTLILSNSATPGLPRFLELDACIHDGWLYFPKKQLFSDQYLYLLFLYIRNILINKGSGSVFTNLKTDILRNQVVLVSSEEMMDHFTYTANLLLNKILRSCEEINVLSEVRNSLLPKLLCGEIEVGVSEIEKEAVA